MSDIRLQAHKGVESEFPENTLSSFRAAIAQGYKLIELDIRVTKDQKFVVIHNATINATGRRHDGSRIEEVIKVSDLTFAELSEYDFGIGFSDKFAGEKIPLFSDVLALSAEYGIPLKIDNKIREFTEDQRHSLYRLIKGSGAHVCISCWSYESAIEAVAEIPDTEISFDGLTDTEMLKKCCALVGRERFTVWFPVDKHMASWAPDEWFVTPEKVRSTLPFAKLGLWAVESVESCRRACIAYKPFAVETTGIIKPEDIKDL